MESQTDKMPIISMKNISKSFGKVHVLKNIHFDIFSGEVHILAGENGAGKSTLIKILSGVYTDFQGEIQLNGTPFNPKSPLAANEQGVVVIHQELSLVPSMSITDNLFLGRPQSQLGFVSDQKQNEEAKRILHRLGLMDININELIENLPLGTQQLIEIGKAIRLQAKVIIMDEPTSALNKQEVDKLFGLIQALKSQGCGIVYISHKMEEIEKIADRITVLRDGEYIGVSLAKDLPIPKLITWMVGRSMDQKFPRHTPHLGDTLLSVKRFHVYSKESNKPLVDDVSFSVRKGEILGFAGLQGAGTSDLFTGLFGAYGRTQGEMILEGKPLHIKSPSQAIKNKIALLTNDRKGNGLVLSMSIIANSTLAQLDKFFIGGWHRPDREKEATHQRTKELKLRAASLDMDVGALSGGNQQKVAISKWVHIQPKLFLLDEPTRGIDIGAKHEIYQLMNEWTAQGITILLITSEMPELLAMSDRIIVMHRGKITSELSRQEATAELVLEAAMGKLNRRTVT